MKKKNLSEMTLTELWQLFPIILTDHNPCWKQWYEQEIEILKTILPNGLRYYHVGSTAISSIMAKPIVDIIIAVNDVEQLLKCAELLQNHGYILMSSQDRRVSLNKGYTLEGYAPKVYYLHVRLNDDVDEIYFCDYLNKNLAVAKEYESLKLRLSKLYKHNRDAYTAAKSEFVNKYTFIAKQNNAL